MNLQFATSDEPVDFLHQRSGVNKARRDANQITDVLIIDDSTSDARAVGALLRGAFGRDVQVRHATSLLRARNMLLERVPELIILDDILPPRDRAETSIAALREARFAGSIVVVSGGLTRIRTQALRAAGATGVIHKDDLNTTELAAAVYGVSAQPASGSSEQSRIKTLGEIDDELN